VTIRMRKVGLDEEKKEAGWFRQKVRLVEFGQAGRMDGFEQVRSVFGRIGRWLVTEAWLGEGREVGG
jgi:hypothetical protein